MVKFTEREMDVIKLTVKGYNVGEMADMLFITRATVKKHLEHIFAKTNCKNRVQLAVWVLINKVI